MQRWVLHIDMDAFFASVEQLTRPTLRGRPVLVGGVSGRGVVAGVSYEARARGARSAMPMYQARSLVGFAGISVNPRHKLYSTVSSRVFEIIEETAGVIQQVSIDEAFLEPPALRGAGEDTVDAWAQQLRERIRSEVGLPSSIGAGSGKQAAKIASELAKPNGVFLIPDHRHREILGPLPAHSLWGIGTVATAKLSRIGVETINDFVALSRKEVELVLGKTVGVQLWQVAQGIDDAPVMPRDAAKSIGAEYTMDKDVLTARDVDAALERAFTAAFQRLRMDGRGARTVTVKTKLADFSTHTRSQSLPYATDDEDSLRAVMRTLVRYPEEIGPIRLLGVAMSNLEVPSQDILFPFLTHRAEVAEDWESGVRDTRTNAAEETHQEEQSGVAWHTTQDVYHPDYGHGWIQGLGHGVVTVRFETRTTAPGDSFTKTFGLDQEHGLQPADPLGSLEWEEWLEQRHRVDATGQGDS